MADLKDTKGALSMPVSNVENDLPPPGYNESNSKASPIGLTRPFVPYRPFQPVMNAYYIYEFSVNSAKTIKLCGEKESDFLYCIEVHTGYSMSGPLGFRPGVILHNGTSRKDPLLAAAGDESQTSSTIYGMNPRFIVLMPRMHLGPGATTNDLVNEMMLAATVPTDKGVAFRFAIEVGIEKVYRESFEWRKIKDPVTKKGGYKLVQQPREGAGGQATGGSSQAASSHGEEETLALLTWPKGWSWFKLAFTLEFKGSGLTGVLGERWQLMAVITAARILVLRYNGKTTKGTVAISEKARGKREAGGSSTAL